MRKTSDSLANIESAELSAGQRAKRTGRWAKIMAKWLVAYSSTGHKQWQIVSFEGRKGGESRGIVDFLAIRRDHKNNKPPLKIGDLFEIILIQSKGGSAPMPSDDDKLRLAKVGKYYHARKIVLATWKKGKVPALCALENLSWKKVEAKDVFR